MVAQTTPTRATLNDAFKYFIANIDFCTTAAQVEEFFCQFGNVNHVKLLPPQPGSSGSTSGGTKGEIQLHRGYGFLFMLDEESCLNVDQYVSSFPENKIMMLGRKGVHVKRQMGMGRGGHDYNTNNGWNANNNAVSNQYHPSWAQYYGYSNMQPHVGGTPYNTSINHQNPQQMAYYPANYYTSPTTVTVGPAGQAQLYSQPAMVSSSTTPYTQSQQQQQQQQQYLTDANYARSVYVPQTNQVVPPQQQQQQQQQYQQQQQLPPHYDPYANLQMNHQQQTQPSPMQQQQQQQQQHPLPPLPLQQQQGLGSMMNNGGRGSEGGGKWQHHHQDNNRSGGGRGGGGRGSINGGGRGGGGGRSGGAGRNGRDGRMDRPY